MGNGAFFHSFHWGETDTGLRLKMSTYFCSGWASVESRKMAIIRLMSLLLESVMVGKSLFQLTRGGVREEFSLKCLFYLFFCSQTYFLLWTPTQSNVHTLFKVLDGVDRVKSQRSQHQLLSWRIIKIYTLLSSKHCFHCISSVYILQQNHFSLSLHLSMRDSKSHKHTHRHHISVKVFDTASWVNYSQESSAFPLLTCKLRCTCKMYVLGF